MHKLVRYSRAQVIIALTSIILLLLTVSNIRGAELDSSLDATPSSIGTAIPNGVLQNAEAIAPRQEVVLAAISQITYVRFERTNMGNIFAAYCTNAPDNYALDWGQSNASGGVMWSMHGDKPALNGCQQGVHFFSGVGDGEHLFVIITARSGGGTTVSRFDLYPTPTNLLNQCTVQTDSLSPLVRDPRYRWDTAAGVACAFVDPTAVGILPTATPSVPTPTTQPNLPTPTSPPPLPTPRPHAAMELYGIEVTQSIQNLKNEVTLIRDRPTYVRAHVRSQGSPVYFVRAELIGRRNGQSVSGSPQTSQWITVRQSPDRASLNDAFLFALPSSWWSDSIELEVRLISDPLICHDHTGQPDDCKAEVTFQASPKLDVRFVGLTWRDSGTKHTPSWSNYQNASQQLKNAIPVPGISWDAPYSIEPAFFAGPPTNLLQFTRLNKMLWLNRLLDGCGWGCKRYYLGILIDPPIGQQITVGKAEGIPGDIVSGYVDQPGTITHEMGHALGRQHVSCTPTLNDEDGPDTNFPYPGGKISRDSSGDNAYYGFNIMTSRTIIGPTTGDLMSYCAPNWPSNYTYTKMRDHLVSRYGTPAALATMMTMAAETEMIVLHGSMEPGKLATLGEGYRLSAPMDMVAPLGGVYAIRFDDESGKTLATYAFDPLEQVDDPVKIFHLALPWSQNTHRVLLTQGDQVLASRVVSLHAPSIGSLTPEGGELQGNTTIAWSADDDDGDPLVYAVQFSKNGGITWQTLVSDWPTTSLELDLDKLPKTTSGIIRVLASDGILTTEAQTRIPVTIQPAPPIAIVSAPMTGATIVNSQALILSGQGYDKDDGDLEDSALQWTSDRDGLLGYGRSLVIDASTLSVGSHQITLTVTDLDGQSTQAIVSIQIAYMDENAAPILLVETTNLEFVVRKGDVLPTTAPLFIRAIGQGEVSWSVQSDKGWLIPSKTSGATPDELFAVVQAAGLHPGEYTATIEVTSTQNSSDSHSVQVRLVIEPSDFSTVFLPMLQH